MKNIIDKFVSQIEEKRERLCVKAERQIDVIDLRTDTANTREAPMQNNTGKYLYVAAAGLAILGVVSEYARAISLTGAIMSAGAGFLISRRNSTMQRTAKSSADISALRTKLTSEIFAISKSVAAEWEEFISVRHEELKRCVSALNIEERRKDEMLSKMYFYETVKVSYPALNAMIGGMTTNNIQEIKEKLTKEISTAIRTAAINQITTFKSLAENE